MSNEIMKYDDETTIKTLKNTVAVGLSDPEFALFVNYCKSTGLNPFKKEIWAIKAGNRLQIMTGINGYLAIANSNPNFDGMEVDVEVNAQGKPVKAVAKVYRKDRKFPSTGIALMSEFSKETQIWKQMPSVMLTKVAKSIAIREAFPQELNGLYTEEEMPREYAVPEVRVAEPVKVEEAEPEEGPFYYSIDNITRKQQLFFEKRDVVWNEERCAWESQTNLGPRLEKFRVKED